MHTYGVIVAEIIKEIQANADVEVELEERIIYKPE
jgi:hypothetical protein